MSDLNFLFTVASAFVLFLFAIESFVREIQLTFKESIKNILLKVTNKPFLGLLTGFISAAIIQSLSTVSLLCISLVAGEVMSLTQALTILMGSNIGTTITVQLMAFKFTKIFPFFLVFGYFLNFFKGKIGLLGRPIFYFGLLFLGDQLFQLQSYPIIREYLHNISSLYWGVFLGVILTFVLQSSSVMGGFVVVLVSQNLIKVDLGISLISRP